VALKGFAVRKQEPRVSFSAEEWNENFSDPGENAVAAEVDQNCNRYG
jgi:hypothetical protein